ncbi:MAG: biotin/lipoyl-binding protein, partial [Thermodesulfobacteriota bacterium]
MSRFVAPAVRAIAIAIAVLFVAACSKTGSEKTAVTVAVAKATVEDLSSDLSLTAELRPFQDIEVMAKVSGYVKVIHVDIGDRVKKGQLLAVLEVPEMADDLTVGKDELRRAQAAHDIADLSFKRLSQVAAQRPGLVAQQEIDDARSRDLVAEA